ncbi:MAG TPA: GldG family protein [Rhodanobacteraceae bacterium]|nr:GldG family protein [Rhodanobacteraceae bacterium]
MRRWRERADAWLVAALLIVAAICIAVLSTRFGFITDWSAGARASISPQSRAILQQLSGPLDAVSYARPGGNLRDEISSVIARYQRYKPDLNLSFVDPDADPAAMRKAGISVDGEVVLHWRDREQHVVQLDERDFTDALARLTRGRERLVAFVIGDGERNADGKANADLGDFVAQLSGSGVRALPLNLAQNASVPRNTDLLVLASPQAELSPASLKAITDYLDRGGNLLWLTEPDTGDVGLAPLATALGLRTLPGMLVDGAGARLGIGDPRMVVENDYPPHAITRGFALNTLFPQVAALASTGNAQWAHASILRSSAQSWNQIAPIDPTQPSTIRYDANSGELRGPLDFGFALTRLSPSPDKSEQRVVVIGDGDFLSNTYLANAGNRAFGERVVDWLLGDDALVALPARGAPDRTMHLTQADLSVVTWGCLVALPLVLLIIGIVIGVRRRRR